MSFITKKLIKSNINSLYRINQYKYGTESYDLARYARNGAFQGVTKETIENCNIIMYSILSTPLKLNDWILYHDSSKDYEYYDELILSVAIKN
mmetsp:Transcript_1787/g.1605  ORF Transcript_1787/g.1605 Transcript_1787/m.1605 type:complete len:93 (+) Transcript_1787:64-342(+)